MAANLAGAAIGTETSGSILGPSGSNGIVGIKPTVGLVSRAGVIPISHTQDTAGPMARTVADAAALLTALAGADASDPATKAAAAHASDYTKALDPKGLKGARIGVARNMAGFHPDTDKLFEDALAEMKRQGAEIVDPADVPGIKDLGDPELEVLLYEFKTGLEAYLAALGPQTQVRSIEALIAFDEKNREREMPYFGQEILLKAQAKGPLSAPEYQKALETCGRLARQDGLDAVLAKHKLDALVAPTGGPVWCTDLVNGDHYTGGYSSASAVAGYPHITVPAGHVFGLPVGLSFFAGAWSEPALLKYAFAFERATKARRAPTFRTAAA